MKLSIFQRNSWLLCQQLFCLVALWVFEKLFTFEVTNMLNSRVGGGGGYTLIIAIRVCATQRGHIFGTPIRFLERGIIFQMHENFKILSAILTVERGIKDLLFFRTGYHFCYKSLLKRGPHFEAWAAHTHPKPTGVPPRGGGGEAKLILDGHRHSIITR